MVKKLKVGELFCGPGGLGWAIKDTKIKVLNGCSYSFVHVWATDYDPDACETFRKNIMPKSESQVFCEDIRTLDYNKLSAIDLLAFGFPCNDFSIVGEQKGINGNFGPLYTFGVKTLNYFKPSFFLAENVSGLRNSNEGQTFKTILNDLHSAGSGYELYPHLYKFEQYGIPQARHRVIIIGIRKDIDIKFKIPAPNGILKTSFQAITDPPIKCDAPNNEKTNHDKKVIDRLNSIKPGQNAFNSELSDKLKLNVKGAKISQIYKKLDPNAPAYTVTGSGGGGTHVYHWKEPRALTNRERARLQTFPDDFVFFGKKESVRKQIGMAVPVEGGKIILDALLKSIAGIKYDYVEPSIKFEYENRKNI
jgi:DNA (cytosine-5)-methyltransferase 1